MNRKERFEQLTSYVGLHQLPEGLENNFSKWKQEEGRELLRHGFLEEVLARFSVPEAAARPLWDALCVVEADERLLELSCFLADDMCDARWRCDTDDYQAMEPDCMGMERAGYSFLLLLACVEPSLRRLRERGVPEERFADIPYRPMREQFRRLVETGNPRVPDFPWDLNFYSCAIFQFDRFLFIPCRMDDPLRVFHNRKDGRVTALYEGGYAFRRDGQLSGACGIRDEAQSFVSTFRETDDAWTGTKINPAGFAEREPASLSKEEWEPLFAQGDGLLAWHIPSGAGYTPERLQNSMRLALEFYGAYFPEIPVRGFWSESWLYDPRLMLALNEKDCNILRTQRQMYLYPIQSDDTMLWTELYHSQPGKERKTETSLQRTAAEWLDAGDYFCATSMFLAREDVTRIGQDTYQTAGDRAAFRKAYESLSQEERRKC